MNEIIKSSGVQAVTMTSLELVQFINNQREAGEAELRHDHFMAKVPQVLGEGGAPNFRGTYRDVQNKERPCYTFPKREACLMAMSYSYDLQAKVFDRMTALESQGNPAFQLPDFANPAVAARAWADAVEKTQVLALENTQKQKLLEEAAPKVQFVDRYVESTGLKGFRQVAKLLGIKEPLFRTFMEDNKIQYLLGGEWHAYQNHIDAGRFSEKAGVAESSGHAFNTCKFTPKGVAWIAAELAKAKVRNALSANDDQGDLAA